MGDTSKDGDAREQPVHTVTLDAYYIGRYPVNKRRVQEIPCRGPLVPFSFGGQAVLMAGFSAQPVAVRGGLIPRTGTYRKVLTAGPELRIVIAGIVPRRARSNPKTGERKWEFKMSAATDAGILTTASDLLFSGGREGYFIALDARTGALLWKSALGGPILMGAITYAVEGRRCVAVAAGNSLFVFGLRD